MKEDLANTNLDVAVITVITKTKKKDKIIRKIENILKLSESHEKVSKVVTTQNYKK